MFGPFNILGHNFNLAHAGTDPESDGVINSVYGDYSDPMGTSSSSWYQFNAGHIDQMGWYANIPGAVATIVAGGTFDWPPSTPILRNFLQPPGRGLNS